MTMSGLPAPYVHPLARVEDDVEIGAGTFVWANAHLRRGARIGSSCVIGSDVTIDLGVVIGDRCKVQNAALLYSGLRIGNGVFVGPAVVFTNDRSPRAVMPDGQLRTEAQWAHGETVVGDGASIGASSTIVTGIRIGDWAMVGAGAVVTRDVPAFALVLGVPARPSGWVCACGARAERPGVMQCASCPESAG
jgi:UDP-2-acetamido-3-amino-2,3-dideoxy-glucuronate N-acetyltransferase